MSKVREIAAEEVKQSRFKTVISKVRAYGRKDLSREHFAALRRQEELWYLSLCKRVAFLSIVNSQCLRAFGDLLHTTGLRSSCMHRYDRIEDSMRLTVIID